MMTALNPHLKLEVCAFFADEFRAALAAEKRDNIELAPIQGACDERRRETQPAPSDAPTLRLMGACSGRAACANGHGKYAVPDETCHARFPLPNPLDGTTSHSTRLQETAAKSLVIPQAGEGANESLREFHSKTPHSCFEFLLGSDKVETLLGEGAHLLTPAMVRAYPETLQGLNEKPENLHAYFAEPVRTWLVVDTGVASLTAAEQAAFLAATGGKMVLLPAELHLLRANLRAVLAQREADAVKASTNEQTASLQHRLADYTMAYDLISRLIPYQSEQALREAEARFRSSFEAAAIGMALVSTEGRFVDANSALCQLVGYSRDELTHKTFQEITHPDDLGVDLNYAKQLMAGERTSYQMEKRYFHKDGHIVWVLLTGSTVRDAQGELLYFIAQIQDITERKQAETALKRHKTVIDTAQDGFWMYDTSGYLLEVNQTYADMMGYTREELTGMHISRLSVLANTPERVKARMEKIISQESSSNFETQHRHKDGHIVHFETSNTFMPESNLVFSFLRDITKRKEYEEEPKRSNAELEQFSYAVSHDMRQPLRMISSYLQLLEMSLSDQLDGEKRDYFNFAIDGAKRIDQMLVALLEYSRVGRIGEPPTWIDSRAVLDEALQFLQPAIAEAQAKVNITGDWPRILSSHDEILRLLQNLIGNAAKFCVIGRTPEIMVASEAVRNEWHLCVADNGVGIIPGQIKRLFQVFQRLQLRTAYEGNGVGLALCRKIAEHHKGRIWAESAGEGKGSKFCVVLPVLRGDTMSAKGAPTGKSA